MRFKQIYSRIKTSFENQINSISLQTRNKIRKNNVPYSGNESTIGKQYACVCVSAYVVYNIKYLGKLKNIHKINVSTYIKAIKIPYIKHPSENIFENATTTVRLLILHRYCKHISKKFYFVSGTGLNVSFILQIFRVLINKLLF